MYVYYAVMIDKLLTVCSNLAMTNLLQSAKCVVSDSRNRNTFSTPKFPRLCLASHFFLSHYFHETNILVCILSDSIIL